MNIRVTKWWRVFAIAAAPTISLIACSDSGTQATNGIGTSTPVAGSGSGDNSGATSSGGSLVLPGDPSAGSGAGSAMSDAGFDACSGTAHEQEVSSSLDIYMIFDRTSSMGTDCEYVHGQSPPEDSKACYATYALGDYLINVTPTADVRLGFQFMSLETEACDGTMYDTPLLPLTQLPLAANHDLVLAISDETFAGGLGTQIEPALRGIAAFTTANATPGREMIGVLMTDGDPTEECQQDVGELASIIADHLTTTGLRTFVIGMDGALEDNLETLALAGGAEPHDDWCGSVDAPCHYWNVGDGSGDAIASALQAIIGQAIPLPCSYGIDGLTPPSGETIDYGKVNVTLTDTTNVDTTIGQVPNAAACPTDQPAWYYDNPSAPSTIELCPMACTLVTDAVQGSRVTVVLGCEDTVVVR